MPSFELIVECTKHELVFVFGHLLGYLAKSIALGQECN